MFMFCKYFLLVFVLFFHSLEHVFECIETINMDEGLTKSVTVAGIQTGNSWMTRVR